jgi:predicted methyltransferase
MRLLLALLAATLAFSQQAAPTTHPTSTPYTGDLSIFEDPTRDQKLHVDRVMDTLGLRAGSSVVDIGAGGGWFSVRAARRVGATGHVLAEDINPTAVDAIRARAIKEKLLNIEPYLGTPDDPKLPPASLDAALMLRVYHEVAHPPLLLASLLVSMKPGARLAVIDHPGHGNDHGINADIVIAEVERSGFRFVKQYDFTKADQNDYLLLFTKP